MAMPRLSTYLLVLCSCLRLAAVVLAQNFSTPPTPAPAPAPNPLLNPQLESAEESCVGVFIIYELLESPEKIYPFVTGNPGQQPYRFDSQVTLINLGFEPVPQWELSIDFVLDEVIADANGVLFVSGLSPPGLAVGNDTRIIGSSNPNLQTSIDTAGNLQLMSSNFTLVGTEFGVNSSGVPLPANMSLVNAGYACGDATVQGSAMWVCCVENATEINSTMGSMDSGFLAREPGDVTVMYDIMNAYIGSYVAQVSLVMENPLGRIDNWTVSWEWEQGEFIESMKGAQILGSSAQDKCVYGPAAVQYGTDSSVDFGDVESCSPNPVIVDLTPDQKYDTSVAIPYCCRNGTLLPALVDPAQSKSNFQLTVKKLSPYTAQDDLSAPVHWSIAPGYQCSEPRKVSPSEFDPGALHSSSAVASWQVICNLTQETVKKCCVSFSAYYNDSVVPCPTSSCSPAQNNTFPWNGQTCNPYIPALLLPSNALLLPPSNRTVLATQLAKMDHYLVPSILPCPDNCGASINWHLYSNYANGWSARITLFNWNTTTIVDWFAAVELPAAAPGFQSAYSFNYSSVPGMNNTLFLEGHNGYDNSDLLKTDVNDNPGKLQSVLSFDKRKTPGINVVQGDGFPTAVWFNGEECQLPTMFPTGSAWRVLPTFQLAAVLIVSILFIDVDAMRIL